MSQVKTKKISGFFVHAETLGDRNVVGAKLSQKLWARERGRDTSFQPAFMAYG
ncbi:MAG: hypothetical protein CM15mP74_14600 [Halieaceae bacterium]|nr:MAG: hypothetical protein CM15mP74_14600 [Halieaceae bacterium]